MMIFSKTDNMKFRYFWAALLAACLFFTTGQAAQAAQDDNFGFSPKKTPVCEGQKPLTAKELRLSLSIMKELMKLSNELTPEDEEAILKSRGFKADRLNCVISKYMAANDIFNWGAPEAYGVSLSQEELETAAGFKDEVGFLKKYLEDTLNITPE